MAASRFGEIWGPPPRSAQVVQIIVFLKKSNAKSTFGICGLRKHGVKSTFGFSRSRHLMPDRRPAAKPSGEEPLDLSATPLSPPELSFLIECHMAGPCVCFLNAGSFF